jgi:hypothetical protein
MPFKEINGANLCYETIGNGDHAVVFIHGGNGGMLSSITAGYGDVVSEADGDKPRTTAGDSSMYGSHIAAIRSSSRCVFGMKIVMCSLQLNYYTERLLHMIGGAQERLRTRSTTITGLKPLLWTVSC